VLEVVCGLIIRNKRILLAQRPVGKSFAYCWETPGGKVEGNESHHQALRRELMEELAIDAYEISEQSFWCQRVTCKEFDVNLIVYPIGNYFGEITSKEKQGFGWFGARSVATLPLTPGGELMLYRILDVL